LAKRIAPAAQIHFILSDVVGDRLDLIASGPTVADPTVLSDAVDVLKRYRLWTRIDPAVRAALGKRKFREEAETPKQGASFWKEVENILIGNGKLAVTEAARLIAATGFRPKVLTSALEGEAREAARVLVALAKEERRKRSAPVCLLAGGETTVTVRGRGKGGRCQEFALSAAIALAGEEGVTVAAFSTDGTDGPTDAAGAVINGDTFRRAGRRGWDARRALDENDAYRFFKSAGGLIRTGPTRTHLNDLYLMFIS
jgi:glycerate-2-kinase